MFSQRFLLGNNWIPSENQESNCHAAANESRRFIVRITCGAAHRLINYSMLLPSSSANTTAQSRTRRNQAVQLHNSIPCNCLCKFASLSIIIPFQSQMLNRITYMIADKLYHLRYGMPE
jgi:hypothetical protein